MNDGLLRELPTLPRKKALDAALLAPELETLLQQLGSPDWQTRVEASRFLGGQEDPIVRKRLVQLLAATDFRVRRAAAEALGHMGAFAAEELLTALTHKSDLVRQSAMAGLRVAEQEACPTLLAALQNKQITRRRAAIEALGMLRVLGAAPALKDCLLDPDAETRWRAAAALGELHALQAAPELITCLTDKDSQVRWAAATALGQIGERSAVTPLVTCLKDEQDVVKAAAVWALGQLGEARVVPSLVKLVKQGAQDVRRSAILALGKLGDVSARKCIIDVLQQEDIELRLAAIDTLRLLRGSETIEALVPLLGEPEASVRHAAVEALVSFGTQAEKTLRSHQPHASGWAATAIQEVLDRLWREQRRAA